MESGYHIVTIRVNETSGAHVWRLRSHYLRMGYDTNGRASVAEPMVHTTLPKVDKVGTSSAEVPMAQALVSRLGSKALNDDPGLLNFTTVESETICRMRFRL
jgi:hypothetical protein